MAANVKVHGDTDPSSGSPLDASGGQSIASRTAASNRPSICWYAQLISSSSLSLYYADNQLDKQTARQNLIRTVFGPDHICCDDNAFMDQAPSG